MAEAVLDISVKPPHRPPAIRAYDAEALERRQVKRIKDGQTLLDLE